MKLCIKQKVFSWGDKFSVRDQDGREKYYVKGEVWTWGKRLHVYDISGKEVAFIRQKALSLLPRYFIYANGVLMAEIIKEFTFLRSRYRIDGLGWETEGNFLAHEYTVTRAGRRVAYIHKEWFTWGDCYTLDIDNPADEIAALAVVLTIDCVDAAASATASGSACTR